MEPITAQQAFETAVRGVITQGKPAMSMINGHPLCRYRGDNGTKCAVGMLIPDEAYVPSMEGITVTALTARFEALRPLQPFANTLRAVQIAHDESAQMSPDADFVAEFKAKLREFIQQGVDYANKREWAPGTAIFPDHLNFDFLESV